MAEWPLVAGPAESLNGLALKESDRESSDPQSSSCWLQAWQRLDDSDKQCINTEIAVGRSDFDGVLTAVKCRAEECQQRRWKFKHKNGEYVILRDVCEKIIRWVDKAKQIGDVAVQYDPGHAVLPWAAIRLCLQATVNDVQTYGAMLEGIEVVANVMIRCGVLERFKDDDSPADNQLSTALINLYVSILEYLAKCVRYFGRTTTRRIVKSVFQIADSESLLHDIRQKDADLERVTNLLFVDRQHRFFQKVQPMNETMKSLQLSIVDNFRSQQMHIEQISQRLDAPFMRQAHPVIADQLSKDERITVFQWLSSIPQRKHHAKNFKDVLRGTGEWLKQKEQYISWRNSSVSSVLWLHGMPGCGKSKIASIVIQTLLEECKQVKSPAPVSYFYCTRNPAERERSDPAEILGSIAKQLSCSTSNAAICQAVVEEYRKRKEEADEDGTPVLRLDVSNFLTFSLRFWIILRHPENPCNIICRSFLH